jgi:hypothetical protein
MIGCAAAGTAQGFNRIGPGSEPGWGSAEENPGKERHRESKCEHNRRRQDADREKVRAPECQSKQQTRGRRGNDQTGHTASDCQQRAFEEGLEDDLPPAGSDGDA